MRPVGKINTLADRAISKSVLRERALQQRRNMSIASRKDQSREITQHLKNLPMYQTARCVVSYTSWPTEPDTSEINRFSIVEGKTLLTPMGTLEHSWQSRTQPALPPQALAAADFIIVPALATDTQGTRLGRGAGWYDQMLAHANSNATIAAIVFENELQAESAPLPRDTHDIPVHLTITPRGVTYTTQNLGMNGNATLLY